MEYEELEIGLVYLFENGLRVFHRVQYNAIWT